MNKSKQKTSIKKFSLRKAIITSFDSFDKKELLVLILTIKKLNPKVENIDKVIISANT